MIKLYLRSGRLQDGDGNPIDVPAATVRAAANGNVTDKLRHAVRAALGEEIVVEVPRASGRSLTPAERRANGLALVQGLWLPAELVRQLDLACGARGETRTAFVRRALEKAL